MAIIVMVNPPPPPPPHPTPTPTPSTAAVFHDFLGDKPPTTATTHGGSPGGALSSTSDLLSERQVSGHFERISQYAPKDDLSVAEIRNRLVGNKRSNSDSSFVSSSREVFTQMIPENSHVIKRLCSTSGGGQSKLSHLDGTLQMRPVSGSFMMKPTAGTSANRAKFESLNPMNVGGSGTQYNSCVGQASPLGYQLSLNKSRDGSSGPSVLSQLAADEGSRTGNKGSGILSSIHARNVALEKNPFAICPSGGIKNPGTQYSEPGQSNPSRHHGLASSSRQMTIIYGGQVHVFDDVHPSKVDAIMALAGSSGGSWCTNLPKSSTRTTMSDFCLPTGENETSLAGDSSLAQKCHKIPNVGGNSFRGLISSNNQGGIIKDVGTSSQAVDSNLETKHEV